MKPKENIVIDLMIVQNEATSTRIVIMVISRLMSILQQINCDYTRHDLIAVMKNKNITVQYCM